MDGAPRRTVPFVECCGFESYYDRNISYSMIDQFERLNGLNWKDTPTWEKIRELGTATVLLEANQHLEAGLSLAEWLPDLPVEYHIPLKVAPADQKRAEDTTAREMALHPMKDGPVVGISCASYRGAEAWKSWGVEEWTDALKRIMALGWRPLLVGADFDDLTYVVACELEIPSTVGKTNVPQMIWQMRNLDAYVGYSSGMNCIRTIWNRPAMAIWPDFPGFSQAHLSRSWAPPAMLESRRYVAALWRPVNDVWPVMRTFLRQCEAELHNGAGDAAHDLSEVHDAGRE